MPSNISSSVVPFSSCLQSFPASGSFQMSQLFASISHYIISSVVSDSLWPHELQHVRLPCPSPTPGVYPNSCPLSRWCHLTILSCHPLFLLPSILPNIRVFSNKSTLHIRWPKYWSFSFNISPSNEHPGQTILEIWANLNMIVFSNSIILERVLNWIIMLCPCSQQTLAHMFRWEETQCL